MNMTILSPGPLSTVQDLGRLGHMRSGFSPNGAMDARSMGLANLLVGNPRGTGVIEMTLMGLSARFDCPAVIALTGADMGAMKNGAPIPRYAAVPFGPGDELTLGAARTGLRGYLAVAGGFALPKVLGSLSTDLKCGLGGFQGRKLRPGDVLPLNAAVTPELSPPRELPPEGPWPEEQTLRVLPGPQDRAFTQGGLAAFFGSVYTVSPQSDRMGLRLKGPAVESLAGVDIISDGTAAGSIQVPASGEPIILMADRQTTGGYAKIATVLTPDLPLAAQARPGTRLRFTPVTPTQALALLRKERAYWRGLEYRMLKR